MALERGTILYKRYRIVEILGQGGMGSVYRAVDENLGVDVAVKENLFTTDEYARQFRLEAVILANLRHPNLPRVTDHFVIGEQGQYLVMDFIEGEDLRQRMERQGRISEEEAVLIGAAICDALQYLHTRKPPILHRDLKPGNVKITPDGHIFLVDFGLAKVVQGSQATTTGARAMTPGYSPPEQYGTARTDPRTDIYSLGATLYAALCGVIPEDGLARAMDNAQLTALRKRNPRISRRLAAVIEKAMAIAPDDRYQTAEAFKQAMLGAKAKTQRLVGEYTVPPPPMAEEQPAEAPPRGAEANDGGKPPASQPQSPPELPFAPRRKRRLGCWLPGLLLLFALAAGVVGIANFYPQLLFPATATATATATSPPTPTSPLPTGTATRTATPTRTPTPFVTFSPTVTLTPLPTPMGGGSGQIAFASDRTGIPQIYLADLSTTGAQPITNIPDGACQPSWSPDGMRIVFVSPCKGMDDTYKDSSLFIINADGSGLTPLSTVPGGDFEPAWAPDGMHIAFTSLRDGHLQIYVLNLADGSVTRLTQTGSDIPTRQPAWSPFGNQIVYAVKRFGVYQIWTMTDTGQAQTQIVRSGQEFWDYLPTWSPDGQVILFTQRRAGEPSLPWLMSMNYEDRDDGQATRLKLGVLPVEDVEYSPDGFWVAFEGEDEKENRDIYVTTLTGANRIRLTTDPGRDFDPAWRPVVP